MEYCSDKSLECWSVRKQNENNTIIHLASEFKDEIETYLVARSGPTTAQ